MDDAIDPVTVALLRAKIEAKLLAHHTGEKAAHRMLLPMGRPHDGGNGRSFRSVQHRKHPSLLRARPAVVERASLSLHLTGATPLASGRLCRNGHLLAGGCASSRSRDFAIGEATVVLLGRGYPLVRSIDGREASACDAKGDRSALVIASPDRQRATGPNLFQQAGADQLSDDLSGGFVLNIRRQFNAAIFALRSRRENDEFVLRFDRGGMTGSMPRSVRPSRISSLS